MSGKSQKKARQREFRYQLENYDLERVPLRKQLGRSFKFGAGILVIEWSILGGLSWIFKWNLLMLIIVVSLITILLWWLEVSMLLHDFRTAPAKIHVTSTKFICTWTKKREPLTIVFSEIDAINQSYRTGKGGATWLETYRLSVGQHIYSVNLSRIPFSGKLATKLNEINQELNRNKLKQLSENLLHFSNDELVALAKKQKNRKLLVNYTGMKIGLKQYKYSTIKEIHYQMNRKTGYLMCTFFLTNDKEFHQQYPNQISLRQALIQQLLIIEKISHITIQFDFTQTISI